MYSYEQKKSNMKKVEAIEVLKTDGELVVERRSNFGTSSLTRPITTGLPDIVNYFIGGMRLSPITGKSLMKGLKKVSSERVGLGFTREIYKQ
jgi:hypothetical protein